MRREDLINELEKVLRFVKESSDTDINMFVDDGIDNWSISGIGVNNSSIVTQLDPNCYVHYEPNRRKEKQ